MKASWEKIEKNTGVLTVEVGTEKVTEALDKAFKKVVGKVNVPGFRKGKVPRSIFEAKFGIESLYQDAIDIILPEVYVEAVKEAGIDPIDRPEIDVQEFGKGQEFKFTAKVLVKPEVELGEYKGLEVPEKDFAVKAEDVDAELKRMQERHAELVVLEEGTAQNGDTVVIDFDGYVDGEAFEGGKAEKYSLELGSGSFIPGFEEQVVGMAKDEEKDVEVTFPESYQAEHLQGKPAVFKVKLHDIKRKNLPELDDEFAKDVSEFDTLEEYKQDIEKNLQERKESEKVAYIENTVVEKAAEAATVEVPEVMVNSEVDQMLRDFANRLRMQGMSLEMYFQFSGQDESALREQMKSDAQKRVLQTLVLDAIASAEQLTSSDEELNEELEKLAKQYNREVDELRAIFEGNDNIESLKKDIVTRKAVKLLVDSSKTVAEAV
jgi:trigger factor